MDRPLPRLLLVGNAAHSEMQPVRDYLDTLVPQKQLLWAASLSKAIDDCAAAGDFPDVIVVCQNWSDEYLRCDVAELFAAFPLATILCCYGSWCDSDGRNRDIWPPGVRVPVRSAPPLIGRLWQNAVAGEPPLPSTAGIEDAFARLHAGRIGHRDRGAVVHIASGDSAIRRWLADALRAAGFAHSANSDDGRSDAAIWDAPVWDERACRELRRFRVEHPDMPLLVLIGGLRPHQAQEALECGADSALPKIGPIDAIVAELSVLIDGVAAD